MTTPEAFGVWPGKREKQRLGLTTPEAFGAWPGKREKQRLGLTPPRLSALGPENGKKQRLGLITPPRLSALLALALFLAACGVKAPPRPPAAGQPQKVRQLTQTVTPDGELVLSWLPPETDMAGRPLKALGGFQIEMADHLDDEHFCAGCPPRYRPEPVRLPARTPPPGRNLDPGPYEWCYRLEPGHVYYFRVAACNQNGGVHPGAWSEEVRISKPGPPN